MRWGAPSAGVVPSACPRLPRGRWHSHPPPPPMVKGGGGGSGRLCGVLGGGQGSQRGPGSYASPTQAINPLTEGVFLPLHLTPNPKPRLNANQPAPQTLPKALVDSKPYNF